MKETTLDKRIYYHDTDAGGIVYYATYLEYLEEARTEYLRELGIDLVEYTKKGILLAVVHVEIDYKSPAKYGSIIRVFTRVEKVGNASINFMQEIKLGETILVICKTLLACVNLSLKPTRIPQEMKSSIEAP